MDEVFHPNEGIEMDNVSSGTSDLKYSRFHVSELASISALIPAQRRGIYVLEFSNGEYYVGQAQNIVRRFAQHRHGKTNHAEAWDDIKRLWFMPVPEFLNLTEIEITEIRRFRKFGKPLRNRALNFGHDQPSPLDMMITVEDQQSWVLGEGPYDLRGAKEKLPSLGQEPSKLLKQAPPEHRNSILTDLAFAFTTLIPEAVTFEGRYWTISDCPSTAGGRWATVNTGFVELLYFPRGEADGLTCLNTVPGTLMDDQSPQQTARVEDDSYDVFVDQVTYPSTSADRLLFTTGDLATICSEFPEVLLGARAFALQAMRQNTSGMFARWHSEALTRDIYQFALEKGLASGQQ